MLKLAKIFIKKAVNSMGFDIVRISRDPKDIFLSYHYQRHNQRRLEHLASLSLDIAGSTVLEVGAGIGDHTSFFIDRGCEIASSDSRTENIKILRSRYPEMRILHIDLDNPPETFNELFDVVYCYGLLYHLKNPSRAIDFMSPCCRKMLLVETCVSHGSGDLLNPCTEDSLSPTQAISGKGCRPTRNWVYNQLKRHFDFVYLPVTQPNHEEFPIDWALPPTRESLSRAIFIASRRSIINKLLTEEIPMKQVRH